MVISSSYCYYNESARDWLSNWRLGVEIWSALVMKQPHFLPERLAKSRYLGLIVPPFDAARRGDSNALISSSIGWVLNEKGTIYDLKGGRVGATRQTVAAWLCSYAGIEGDR